MGSLHRYLTIFITLIALSGCAHPSLYTWNSYDETLYKYYKDPVEHERFITVLKETLDNGEATGRVPPGIYAEYGFAMFEMGDTQTAIQYYRKEADKWPESRLFMDKLIAMAQNRTKPSPSDTPPLVSPAVDGQQAAMTQ